MPKKILLADDSVTIQKVVELTFSEGDYSVTSVSNGKLAIEQLRKERPDLAIVDIIMPEMSGYDVAEYIKKNPEFSAIPVILLTGTFEPFDEERARKTGAETYVTKPFDSKMLIEKVESLLAQKVKVESVEKIPPATIFQSRQEYEIPGVVSEEYIEKMKTESEQEFPKIEELQEKSEKIPSSMAADFIPSVDEIQQPPAEESPVESTAISGEPMPPSDFEGFETLAEPPLPSFNESIPSNVEVQESLNLKEEPFAQESVQKEDKKEFIDDEIKVAEKDFAAPEPAFKESPPVPETPSFEEAVVEIPPAVAEESVQQENVELEKPLSAEEEGFAPVEKEEEFFSSNYQESVVEVGEEKEIPPFFESAPSFEEPVVSEKPEIVTDLTEQVMMVAEGQQKLEEEKKEITKESEVSSEEPPVEETSFEQLSAPIVEKVLEEEPILEKKETEEHITEQKEKPVEEVVEPPKEQVEISPEMIESAVRKVVEELAPSIIKDIAWEVIPELANTIIKKRIEELEKEIEK